MNWLTLSGEEQFLQILKDSENHPIAVFKHSTRCSVSVMAKRTLENSWERYSKNMPIYYLDLLQHRNVSNLIAETLGVQHQSPQLIIIQNGKAIYHASHSDIDAYEAVETVN